MSIITEKHKKIIAKELKYKAKLENKLPEIKPEQELRVRDLVTQLALSIRFVNFSLKQLIELKVLPRKTKLQEAIIELIGLEDYFIKSESAVNPNWKEEFNDFENFIWNFTHHSPENKDRIMKFAESLWKKKN